jgi:hypothetical protein
MNTILETSGPLDGIALDRPGSLDGNHPLEVMIRSWKLSLIYQDPCMGNYLGDVVSGPLDGNHL